MKSTIKIQFGKFGYFLVVNGNAIKREFTGDITATKINYNANNWIATEWQSVSHLKAFWNDYREIILSKAK